jgi:hypothetical protein
MVSFFIEGGWGMYPVTVMGMMLVWAAIRYAIDTEPVRLRFITAIALALVVTMVYATWTCIAAVFAYLERSPGNDFVKNLMTGLMESTRPAVLGGALLVIALILVVIGVYRSGQRELRVLRSQ